MRLGLGVDIDADRLPVVVRPMLDFERAAADTQGGISAENENAGRGASPVLPGCELVFASLKRPIARFP